MDNFSINARRGCRFTECTSRDAAAILLIEIDGLSAEVADTGARIQQLCRQNGARSITIATEPEERLRLWKGRKAAFAAMGKLSPDYYVQDGVIPRTQLPPGAERNCEALGQKSHQRLSGGQCVPRRRWQSPSPDSLRQLGAPVSLRPWKNWGATFLNFV